MARPTKASPAFVICIWDDAWAESTDAVFQNDAHEKHMPTVMDTRGWLVYEDEKGVSIFNERCLDKGENYYRSRTFIPRTLIRSITEVKLTPPRRKRAPAREEPSPTSNPGA